MAGQNQRNPSVCTQLKVKSFRRNVSGLFAGKKGRLLFLVILGRGALRISMKIKYPPPLALSIIYSRGRRRASPQPQRQRRPPESPSSLDTFIRDFRAFPPRQRGLTSVIPSSNRLGATSVEPRRYLFCSDKYRRFP